MKISIRSFPIWFGIFPIMAALQIDILSSIGEIFRWILMFVAACGALIWRPKHNLEFLKNYWALFILIIISLSAVWSINPSQSIYKLISIILLYMACFGGMRHWINIYGIELFLSQISIFISLVILLNFLLGLFVYQSSWLMGSFRGFFVNPNQIALLAGFISPLILRQYIVTSSIFYIVIFFTIILTLFLSNGRTGIIMTFFSCVLLLISYRSQVRSISTFLLLFIFPIIIILFYQWFYGIYEGIINTENLLSNRQIAWDILKYKIQDRPLFGHGFGTDAGVWKYYEIDLGFRMHGAASSYYGLAYQLGIPFTIFFFTILAFIAIKALFIGISKNNNYFILISIIIMNGFLASFTEPWISSAGNAYSWFYWIFVMLAIYGKNIDSIKNKPN